jgi:hypothetical protein
MTYRSTQCDACRQRDLGGDVEQLAQFAVDELMPHRQRSAVPERPRREQKVLAGRVDGGAFGDICGAVAAEADEDDYGDAFEVVDVVLHRCRHPTLPARGVGGRPAVVAIRLDLDGPPAAKRFTEN